MRAGLVLSGEIRHFQTSTMHLYEVIQSKVTTWREAGYPGVTSITKALLENWRDPNEFQTRRFFFCQLEAIETTVNQITI